MKLIASFAISILVLVALAVGVFSADILQISPDLVEPVTECSEVTWEEVEPEYGSCTADLIETVCDDAPTNKSCHENAKTVEYTCQTGEKKLAKSRRDCLDVAYLLNKTKIDTSEYVCSLSQDKEDVILICDSIYDGNGDGICSSGESCIRYTIADGTYTAEQRNSQDEWSEKDNTFFLKKTKEELVK